MTAGRTNSNQKSKEWCTPPKYAKVIHEFFDNNLELDPCSNEFSIIKARKKFIYPETDGLIADWRPYSTIYVNPPYGRNKENGTSIKNWIEKCYRINLGWHSEIMALIPVATNTRHWKEFIFGEATICFLYDTRLKFMINGSLDNKGAPMSCAMVYWGNRCNYFQKMFSSFGYCVV